MASSVLGFLNTWSPAQASTAHRIEVRNIRQGGNNLLAAMPQAGQAMWASPVIGAIETAVPAPFNYIAQFFRAVFHPIVSTPLSLLAASVKDNIYQSSIAATMPAQTQHYATRIVDAPRKGTISLEVDGVLRHFPVLQDSTYAVEQTIPIEEEGVVKFYGYRTLRENEPFDEKCREVDLNGIKTKIKLQNNDTRPERSVCITIEGQKRYFLLGTEVPEPLPHTVDLGGFWNQTHYLLENKLAAPEANCITISTHKRQLYYDTGREVETPTPQTRTFFIDGVPKYFLSARNVESQNPGVAGVLNKIPYLPITLPTRLSLTSINVLNFINDNLSDIVRIALVVSGIALSILGQFYLAAGILVAVAYEHLDHDLNLIPRQMSLFLERWMPLIASVGVLIAGSIGMKFVAAATIILYIPEANLWLHHKIDSVFRKTLLPATQEYAGVLMREMGFPPHVIEDLKEELDMAPLLEEFDAPLIQQKHLSKSIIEEILSVSERDYNDYEINPAHCSKSVPIYRVLPEDRDFDKLITMWDENRNKWSTPRFFDKFILPRLADDDRFIEFLKVRWPEAKLLFYENDFHKSQRENTELYEKAKAERQAETKQYIAQLAQEKGRSSEVYAADWVKEQLNCFVGKLKGTRAVEGDHVLLEEAVENTAKIIPFLLDKNTSAVDREDALLKLAIEGGDYCNLAMKRASEEVLEGFTTLLPDIGPDGQLFSPQEAFEREAYRSLQKERLRCIQQGHNIFAKLFRKNEELRTTGEDIHLYEAVAKGLRRGFYPLSEREMQNYGLTDFMLWESIFFPGRVGLLEFYKASLIPWAQALMKDKFNERNNHFLSYVRTTIQENKSLSQSDKQELLSGPLSDSEDNLIDDTKYPGWILLTLVILGVVQKKREIT